MEIQQLRYFVTVARRGSFSDACEELFVTRTALSKSVSKLETELGYPLFERSRDGVRLTPAGERLFAKSQALVDGYDLLEKEIKTEREVPSISVSIPNSWVDIFADSIDMFRKSRPEVRIDVISASDSELVRRSAEGEFDVVISHIPLPDTIDDGVALIHSPVHVSMSDDCPLAAQEYVTRDDMKAYDILYYPCGYDTVFWVPTIGGKTETFSNDLMHIYAKLYRNEGIFPVPMHTIPQHQRGIVSRPYKGAYSTTVMCGYISKKPSRSPELEQLCKDLREALIQPESK